jgi:hypothetical protein
MLKPVLAACAVLSALSFPAAARERPRVAPPAQPACVETVMRPCYAALSPAELKEARRVARGRYIADQLGIGSVADKPVPRATRRHKTTPRCSPSRTVPEWDCPGSAKSSAYGAPSPSFGYSIARPARYIAGRLRCAVNVNVALAERGIRGTGSALAKSFLHWGVASGPVPGAIAVSERRGGGGHVAIVRYVRPDGTIIVWNPSPRGRGWQEAVYRHRAISFRVPG